MFSDVGPLELLTLAIIAVLLFGPDKLPELLQNVTGFLRKVREYSENAKNEIRSELGPEFKDFELEDLRPATFVRKHLLDKEGQEGGDGLGLGLAELRDALDPRKELTQFADAVREATDGSAPRPADAAPSVDLAKNSAAPASTPAPTGRTPYDPDAT